MDEFKRLMLRVRGIVSEPRKDFDVSGFKQHFDTRMKIQLLGYSVPILVLIFTVFYFMAGVKAHMNEGEDLHLDMQENIILSEVPIIKSDVKQLSFIVLANERGLLIVETKLVEIEKKIDRILAKLGD